MKVSVFGLGYVGCVSSACLARDGHWVSGVDVSSQKVESVRSGLSPVIEARLDDLIRQGVASGNLKTTSDAKEAVHENDVSMICVGTPSNGNGDLCLKYVENVSREIGSALADKKDYHVVVVRSTVLPGSVRNPVITIREQGRG